MINRTSSFFLTLLLLLLSLTVGAETIEGVVVDTRSHEPLVGVSVGVKQARKLTGGVTTDINGRFKVNTDADFPLTLEFHYVGYQTTSVLVYDASEEITVTLTEQQNRLANVVVVGYGTQKRENLTSSIASVGGRVVNELNTASLENALAGQTSGISLTVPNGTIGQAPIVRVRGVASITSGTQPLYVVDGVPIANETYSGMNLSNPLGDINPNDIESIDVLKDASAAALYGSRAANGVVLITTKQGKKGKLQIEYQGSVTYTTPKNYNDVCNAQQYVDLKNEAVYNRYGTYTINNYDVTSGTLGGYHIKGEQKAFNLLYDDNGNIVETDWERYTTRKAWSHNHTVSASGGTDAVSYYFSGNWQDLNGIIRGSNHTRLQFNANIKAKANKWLTVGGKATLTEINHSDFDSGNNSYWGGASAGYYWSSLNVPGNIPAHFANGEPWSIEGRVGYGPNQTNVAMDTPSVLYDTDSHTKRKSVHRIYNVFADITPVKGLVIRTQYGRDIATVEDRAYYAPTTNMYRYNGYAANISSNIDQYTWTNTATYSKDFESGHHFDILGGVEAFEKTRRVWGAQRYNETDDLALYEANYNDISSLTTAFTEVGMLSYLFRANYDWKSRYIASFNFRRDGLSSLSKDNRWGNFGGVSAAWKISEEKFYAPIRHIFDDVKLRASWGVVGNTSISAYASSSTFSSEANGNAPAYQRSTTADKNLKWEQSSKLDVGFSGRLFNRVDIDFGFYRIKGSDLILSVPTAPSRGVTNNSITSNVGSMTNTGFEVSIGADIIRKRKFHWSTNFNISFNKNKVTSLGGAESIVSSSNITQVGKSIGQLYLYRSGGVDTETGRRIVYDQQGKEVLIVFQNGSTSYQHRDGTTVSTSDLDRHTAGNTIPTYYGGWSNQLSYKHWDLALNFQFSGGNKIWNGQKGRLAQYGFRNNTVDVYKNHWSENNKVNAKYSIPIYGDNISNGNGGLPLDFLVEDGDYFRLKTLTLGYNFERKSWLKAAGITSIRVYLQTTNVFTITGYSGLDPEVSNATSASANAYNLQAGLDDNSTPQTRTFTLGVNVKF